MTDLSRRPRAVQPERVAPLATLPLFHKLAGRTVILTGAGDGVLWKAELLAASGALVRFFSTRRDERLEALQADLALRVGDAVGRIEIILRPVTREDFKGAALAVSGIEDRSEAARFAAEARAQGVPVNVIDKPAFCDFSFGAIVNRSPLVIGISTDGAAPVLGMTIRTRIEGLLPRSLRAWTEAAQAWRPVVQSRLAAFGARRTFWRRFAEQAMTHGHRAPTSADSEALFAAGSERDGSPAAGCVMLVGAGPGDPDLLTIKAVRALQSADIILFDDLVTTEVLDLARREAERMRVGKLGHGPSCRQEDINELMVALAREGKRVVRLKGGDPSIFGRATEEIAACRAAGVPMEIIPGITAAQGAAAALGVSLTERNLARRLQFITGHDATGALPPDINWTAVADPAASTVIYMPRRTLSALREQAVTAGLSPQTPAVAVQNVSRPDQVIVTAALADLPERMSDLGDGPVVVLIGDAFRAVASENLTTHLARVALSA